jgi:hypothetical protein
MQALTVRQPWAWLIVHGYKDIENRTWPTRTRGTIYIHAAKGMTWEEYEQCREIATGIYPELSLSFPAFEDLDRGAIVGRVKIVGCTERSRSEWFFGPWGFELAEAEYFHRPYHCKGALGFFTPEVQP